MTPLRVPDTVRKMSLEVILGIAGPFIGGLSAIGVMWLRTKVRGRIADGGQQNQIIKQLLEEAREDRVHLRKRIDELEKARELESNNWDTQEALYRNAQAVLQEQLTKANWDITEQARRITRLERQVVELGGKPVNGI